MEEYELRKAMLESMDDKEIRSIIFNKKKEASTVRVPSGYDDILTKLASTWGFQYDFVHNTFLSILREPYTNVVEILEKEIKRRTSNFKNWESIEDIKARVNICDVVSHYIPSYWSMRRWANIKCPFHDDWTASLHVYEKTNSFKCFWCNAWGTAIDFIMKSEECSLREAIQRLKQF